MGVDTSRVSTREHANAQRWPSANCHPLALRCAVSKHQLALLLFRHEVSSDSARVFAPPAALCRASHSHPARREHHDVVRVRFFARHGRVEASARCGGKWTSRARRLSPAIVATVPKNTTAAAARLGRSAGLLPGGGRSPGGRSPPRAVVTVHPGPIPTRSPPRTTRSSLSCSTARTGRS